MKKNVFTASLLICVAFQIVVPGIEAAEVCEWSFRSCPEAINNQLITVPDNVIALSPNIRACEAMTQSVSTDTPAIMFVIDNSGSMVSDAGGGNDVDGARFEVTRDLLDTIFKAQPGARVGLSVFRAGLYFDKNTHDIFEVLEGVPDSIAFSSEQAYLPPLKLDSTYNFNDTTMRGIDILKFLLRTRNTGRNGVQLEYQPLFEARMQSGTNINYGFDGALQGFEKLSEDLVPKENRFIVFFSDGKPSNHGHKQQNYFEMGYNTPTTFTVYLHNRETVAPEVILNMTQNIRDNGYSETNIKSDIWVLRADRDSLMSLFMSNVMNIIINKNAGKPTVMKLNGQISTTFSDSAFKFNKDFAISNDTSEFTLEVTWRMTDEKSGRVYDSSATTGFKIVRSSKVNRPTEGFLNCWERDLFLQYDGKPITAVNETMNKLEAVFTTNSNRYKSVIVEITHKSGTSHDILGLPLVEGDSKFSANFDRQVGPPNVKDKILQHEATDSIILIYRNPDNPLDTIRKSYPFAIGKILKFPEAHYYDNNADGKVDSIYIKVEGSVVKDDLEKLKSSIVLPSNRNFKLDSISIVKDGIALHVKEQNKEIRTYVTSTDVIMVNGGILPAGGIITEAIVNAKDRVAPVLLSGKLFSNEQDSLQVEFSEPVESFISKEPILFSHGGKAYQVILAENGVFSREATLYTARVISVQTGSAVSEGDMIWINPAARIGDTIDNKQLNPDNRKVPLTVQEVKYDIVIKTVNNPMRPDVPIPPIVKNAFEQAGRQVPDNGLVIVIEPKGDIKSKIKMEGSASVYDVVKSLIKKDIEGVFDPNTQKFFMVWDGVSEKRRKVGTGTYTAVIRVTTISEKTNSRSSSVQKIAVGVQRKRGSN